MLFECIDDEEELLLEPERAGVGHAFARKWRGYSRRGSSSEKERGEAM